MTVTTEYVCQRTGKTRQYIANWLRIRPSLKIKFSRQKKGNVRFNVYEKEEADRLVQSILSKRPQDFNPHNMKSNKDDFTNPDWWDF